MAELEFVHRRDIIINKDVEAKVGGSGKVEQGVWINKTGQKKVVAVKSPKDPLDLSEKDFQKFQLESSIMASVKNSHCVALLAAGEDFKDPMMVMEWMDGGDLKQELGKLKPPPGHARLRIAREIVSAVDYLHKRGIIHSDLKSLNVMLTSDLVAKICDFGSAMQKLNSSVSLKSSSQSGGSTVRWSAPELLQANRANKQTDVYALGIIMWELSMCEVPFSDVSNEQILISAILKGKKPDIPDPLPSCACTFPPKYFQIMKNCWNQPEQRPTASELLAALKSIDPTARPAAPLLLYPPMHTHPSGSLFDCIPKHLPANKNNVWAKMVADAEKKSKTPEVVALCNAHGLSPLEAQSLTVRFLSFQFAIF
jgi:serine/threonine protein kinase